MKNNIFDYEADWVPHKGRVFKMKPSTKEEEQEEDQREPAQAPTNTPQAADQRDQGSKLYSGSEGLDMAYGDQSNIFLDPRGTLFVSGTKGGFLGQEWIENYKTMGVPLIQKMLGMPSDYSIERKREVQANR